MRKTMMCLVASLITLTGANAFAQEVVMDDAPAADSSSFQIGVVGLLNYSTMAYSADSDDAADAANDIAGYKLGFGGGLRAIMEFSPFIGIQPEILFKQYGATGEVMGIESSTTLNYLQVPILARIAIPVAGPVTPKVLVGPTFGYFLSGSTEAGDLTDDIEGDDVNKFDIGVAAGVGADIAAGPGSLSVDLRYDRSFTGTQDEDDPGGLNNVNTGFGFMLGYNYAL